MPLPDIAMLGDWAQALAHAGLAAAIAIAVAIAVHLVLFAVLDRIARASAAQADDALFDRLRQPVEQRLSLIHI